MMQDRTPGVYDGNFFNYELSCQGPHFNRGDQYAHQISMLEKIYQPYNGPTIPCDKTVYTESGQTIMYPSSGNYKTNLNCYFKIVAPKGKHVKITFTAFDFQAGVDYGIDKVYPSSKEVGVPTVQCSSSTTDVKSSCGECLKPAGASDNSWCDGGTNCKVAKYYDVQRHVTNRDSSVVPGVPGEPHDLLSDFCVRKDGVTPDVSYWCHGENDFLQIDQKTMRNYTDRGSQQNRFCGAYTSPAFPPEYTSETNELILWMKTNLDTDVGSGFTLTWTTVDP